MTTAIYVRVSTKQQDQRSQLHDLAKWVKQLDEEPQWFEDKATGTKMAREGFQRLLDAARAGEVTTVVVWRLDRLGRTARGLTELFEEFIRLGVKLVSLREGVDLSTPAGRLICNVLASVAQFETEVRSERQMTGIAAVRAKNGGKCTWGGSKPGPRAIGPEEAATALAGLRAGLTQEQVAMSLGVSSRTLRRHVRGGRPGT